MKVSKIAACVSMLLAVVMLLLPFYKFTIPSYFEQKDITGSGFALVKDGLAIDKGDVKDQVEGIRSLIKDCDELEDLYKALGKASRLVLYVKLFVLIGFCLPCILLIAGAIAGFMASTKKRYLMSMALNIAAFVAEAATGILAFAMFQGNKTKVVDGLKGMDSVSTGINFLDTVLDSATDVIAKNIDKITFSYQIGWYLFLGFTLAALICWIVTVAMEKPAENDVMPDMPFFQPNGDMGMGEGFAVPGQDEVYQDGPIGMDIQNQGRQGMEDPPTFRRRPNGADVNSYGLPAVDPDQPSASMRGLEGEYQDVRIPMETGRIVMGRDASAASLVFGPSASNISRRHCEICYDPGLRGYRIKDVSKNGVYAYTYENGRYAATAKRLPKNEEVTLAAGTIIDIGNQNNRFRLE